MTFIVVVVLNRVHNQMRIQCTRDVENSSKVYVFSRGEICDKPNCRISIVNTLKEDFSLNYGQGTSSSSSLLVTPLGV